MCGVVGLWNRGGVPADVELLKHMRDRMLHRGPDDAGLHVDGDLGLGHRRLSIVGLDETGRNPMTNEDGSLWLVFNGEIYNYVELREELEARGHRFRSQTDTECILHLYEEYGEACLDHLNGMFGFLLWDGPARKLFGARDRMGIKPLYYAETAEALLFASEIKAILAHPAVRRDYDRLSVADYFFCGVPQEGRTFFSSVKELPPAHAFVAEGHRIRVWEYWSLEFDYRTDRSQAQVEEELGALVQDAVRIHTRSDASIGAHLSGGLDSSTVAAMARPTIDPLKTFTIKFSGGDRFDESPYARAVAEHIGSTYVEEEPGAFEFQARLPHLIWHSDQPMMGAGGFAYWTGSRLAARHVKVALTGHGGDEVFGGYPAQFLTAFGSLDMFDLGNREPDVTPSLMSRLRRLWSRGGAGAILRRLLRTGGGSQPQTPEDLWVRLHCGFEPGRHPLLEGSFLSSLGGYSPREPYLRHFSGAATESLFDRCLHHDLRAYLPGLLQQEDRASMSVSLESRVPLLDYRLAEFLATVPVSQKIPNHVPKELLRSVAKGWIPESVRNRRDKGAFAVPVERWYRGELKTYVRNLLLSDRSLERGIFSPSAMAADDLSGPYVWTLLNLEAWFRVFVDEDPDWAPVPMAEVAQTA